jgi:hypothetical protein
MIDAWRRPAAAAAAARCATRASSAPLPRRGGGDAEWAREETTGAGPTDIYCRLSGACYIANGTGRDGTGEEKGARATWLAEGPPLGGGGRRGPTSAHAQRRRWLRAPRAHALTSASLPATYVRRARARRRRPYPYVARINHGDDG